MMPAGPLMIEHRLIERMIDILVKHVKAVPNPEQIDLTLIEKGTDFLRTYADRCHHGKEEDILFKALEKKELKPEEKRIFDELIEEHAIARATVKSIIASRERALAGDKSAFDEVASLVMKIGEIYPPHIEKEDKHFFLPVMSYFSDKEQAEMLRQFDEFDKLLIHEKYQNIVSRLENEPDITTAAAGKTDEAVYVCSVCGYRYEPGSGDPQHGIKGGTAFDELPEDWVCPLCGAGKTFFEKES